MGRRPRAPRRVCRDESSGEVSRREAQFCREVLAWKRFATLACHVLGVPRMGASWCEKSGKIASLTRGQVRTSRPQDTVLSRLREAVSRLHLPDYRSPRGSFGIRARVAGGGTPTVPPSSAGAVVSWRGWWRWSLLRLPLAVPFCMRVAGGPPTLLPSQPRQRAGALAAAGRWSSPFPTAIRFSLFFRTKFEIRVSAGR